MNTEQDKQQVIKRLLKLYDSKQPAFRVHGQVVGMEPYILNATGIEFGAILEAVELLSAPAAANAGGKAPMKLSAGWVHDGDCALNPATGERVPYPTGDIAIKPLTRYGCATDDWSRPIAREDENGNYVLFDDAEKAINAAWLDWVKSASSDPDSRPTATSAAATPALDEREAFEQAMNAARFFPAELDFSRTKSPSGRDEYVNTHLQSSWLGWQARAALSHQAQDAVDAARYRKYRELLVADGRITAEEADAAIDASMQSASKAKE